MTTLDFLFEFKCWINSQLTDYKCFTLIDTSFDIVAIKGNIWLHFIPIGYKNGQYLQKISLKYQEGNIKIIHIWEDVWRTKPSIVQSRIRSILGICQRIHGRQTTINAISQTVFDNFMNAHHLQGTTKAKIKLGLYHQKQLVAAASFSKPKAFYRSGNKCLSGELIRYANMADFTVVGGLSKLIRFYQNTYPSDDLMTYADMDWSDGKTYEKLGFHKVEITEPQQFIIDAQTYQRHYPHRLIEYPDTYFDAWNTGNIKLLKIFNNL